LNEDTKVGRKEANVYDSKYTGTGTGVTLKKNSTTPRNPHCQKQGKQILEKKQIRV
jgi:hypothetical protein